MMNQILLLLSLVLSLNSMPLMAQSVLPVKPFVADYRVYVLGVPLGKATIRLQDEGRGRYSMFSDVRPEGLAAMVVDEELREQVSGEFLDGFPQPLRYEQERGGKKAGRTELAFDWNSGKVEAAADGKHTILPLVPRVVDPLSLHLLVMADLINNRSIDEYTLIDDTELKTYQIKHNGNESLETPLGELNTILLSRQREGSSRILKLWFAPRFDYLPVRITQYKKGK